jgi:hypothetical protein
MTFQTDETTADLLCHVCDYDLRAHPQDGTCPECGASVAESRRLTGIPRRPAWRDSDPRWRRRILAGVWLLVLLPLMDALRQFGWAARVRVPNAFGFPGTVRSLSDTFLFNMDLYQSLVFCVGVVLLFSRERGRRRGRLDWTRRWGVICSYVTLLLSAAPIAFITSLVVTGIAAVFLSMPPENQPRVTQLLVNVGAACLAYGPQPKDLAGVVAVAFSSTAILLACVPLFDALRSTGPKRAAAMLLAPLALFALMHLAQAAWYAIGFSNVTTREVFRYGVYFSPAVLVHGIAELPAGLAGSAADFFVEAGKWCVVLTIAVWLTLARLATAWRRAGRRAPQKPVARDLGADAVPTKQPPPAN